MFLVLVQTKSIFRYFFIILWFIKYNYTINYYNNEPFFIDWGSDHPIHISASYLRRPDAVLSVFGISLIWCDNKLSTSLPIIAYTHEDLMLDFTSCLKSLYGLESTESLNILTATGCSLYVPWYTLPYVPSPRMLSLLQCKRTDYNEFKILLQWFS